MFMWVQIGLAIFFTLTFFIAIPLAESVGQLGIWAIGWFIITASTLTARE